MVLLRKVCFFPPPKNWPTCLVKLRTDVLYLDVTTPKDKEFQTEIPKGFNGFVYVLEGAATFAGTKGEMRDCLLLQQQPEKTVIHVKTSPESHVRFVLIAGEPMNEPMARYGPFVIILSFW